MSRKTYYDTSTVKLSEAFRKIEGGHFVSNDIKPEETNPEMVSPPLENPAPIYGQRAGYTPFPLLYTVMSDDWRLVLSCLAFLWSCTLVGLFSARFPLAGRVICWMVLSAISTTLVWKLIQYWGARRRNQNYVSV